MKVHQGSWDRAISEDTRTETPREVTLVRNVLLLQFRNGDRNVMSQKRDGTDGKMVIVRIDSKRRDDFHECFSSQCLCCVRQLQMLMVIG
jgi:hypothetical protein